MVAPIFLGGSTNSGMAHITQAFTANLLPERPLAVYTMYDDDTVAAADAYRLISAISGTHDCIRVEGIHDLAQRLDAGALGGILLQCDDPLAFLRSASASQIHRVFGYALQADVPVYTSGAGAVALGCDIRTLLDEDLPAYAARGAGLLRTYAVYTGYTPSQSLHALVNQLGTPLIALPVTAGIAFKTGRVTAYGTAPVDVLTATRAISIYPGATYRIT